MAGNASERWAKEQGMSGGASFAVGTTAAMTGGAVAGVAAALILATAPVSLPVIAGAALVGALAGGLNYLMTR